LLVASMAAGMTAWGWRPANAAAYGEPRSFTESAMIGGGGGKFFTGSHAEGYTCQVCHTGGPSPQIHVIGLPVDGYIPNQTYRITVDWSDDLPAVGLNLEMTDTVGNRFGELTAIDPALLSPADLCVGAVDTGAAETVELENGRRVLTVARCGQQQTTFQWRAPAQIAQGWLSGSVVASNRKKDVLGDGVTNISHTFGVQGLPAPEAGNFVASCNAVHTRQHGTALFAVILGWVASRVGKRLCRKRSSRSW
jgi:hypothetical protein